MSSHEKQRAFHSGKRKRHEKQDLVHPYILKFDARQEKIVGMLNRLNELADSDMVICDCRTGLNDYSMNKKFAGKLDNLAKVLVTLSKKCYEKATALRNKISEAEDKKRVANQEIFYIEQVMKETDKCDVVQNQKLLHSGCFKTDPDCLPPVPTPLIKRKHAITISSDEEGDIYPGDADTKFMFPRDNNIDKQDRFKCQDCSKQFNDLQELCNHYSHHTPELYRCLKCNSISRSEHSFQNHQQTHLSQTYNCPVKDCGQFFELKTSLTNHMQKHSEDRMHCSVCGKEFQYRQSALEHEKYHH